MRKTMNRSVSSERDSVGNGGLNSSTQFKRILNKTGSLIAIGVVLFLLHWASMYVAMSDADAYRLEGKWTTIPDFQAQITAPESALTRVYSRLNGWDGQWYYHIAANGYSCAELPQSNNPLVCNLAFFPLAPLIGKALSYTGLSLTFALPLASQLLWLASILICLFILRSISGVSAGQIVVLSLLVSYPGAMYALTSYSEPTLAFFILAIASLSHWHLVTPGWGKIACLSIACFLVCLVKITGVFALAIPFLMALLPMADDSGKARRARTMLLIPCMVGVTGLASFFAYSYFAFGQWDLYLRYVSGGWNYSVANHINLNPAVIFTSFTWPGYLPMNMSNVLLVLSPLIFIVLTVLVFRRAEKYQSLVPALLITAFFYYYFYAVVGHTPESVHGDFLRHMLPVIAMVVLALAIIFGNTENTRIRNCAIAAFSLLSVTGFYLQHKLYELFSVGLWVS